MPVGCAVHFVQRFAAVELLAQTSSVLMLLGAGILVFRTFRERHLLAWLIGWLLYLVYRLTTTETALLAPAPALTAISNSAFIVGVAMFAAAVLYYTNARRYLFALAIVAVVAVDVAVVRAVWFPQSRLLGIGLHALYMVMTIGAALRLALFSRGRRELGLWLASIMLVLVHMDEVSNSIHAQAGVDFVIEMLLGLSMVIIVLDDSKSRTRRLAVVNTITNAITDAKTRSALMLVALQELKALMGMRAAWSRVFEGDRLAMAEHIGLSEQFLRDCSVIQTNVTYVGLVVQQGLPAALDLKHVDPALRQPLANEGFTQLVLVPIKGKNSVIGVLALAADRHRSYTPDEMRFLLNTANQLGVALENLKLFEQILRSRRQWIDTFDSIDEVILLHDSNFQILRVNRALLQRLGRPHQEVVSQSCESILPHAEPWERCPYCAPRTTGAGDAPDPCFGGYSLVSTSSYSEEGSARLGTIHIVKDTTQQRAAEEKYRMLFEQVQEGVFISTPEGRVLDCNDAFVRMLGYSRRAELFTVDIARDVYVYPDQRDAFRQEMAANGFVRNYEVTLRRRDGSAMTVLENSFATRDSSGQIERYQGFLLDVTEKKRAEDEIRRRNRELYALNAIAVIATQSFDLDEILNLSLRQVIDLFTSDVGSVFLFDAGALTLRRRATHGHRSELGMRLTTVEIPPEYWEPIQSAHTEILTEEDRAMLPPVIIEFVNAEKLRSWLWCVMWSKEKPVGLLGIASHRPREFSTFDEHLMIAIGRQLATTIDKVHLYEETCRAYDDLRRTQEQLLQSEKMSAVGQLISGVAHELNNPLTAILGYAQLLEAEDIGQRCRDYIQKLYKQAQRTQRIVQNLLSFARQRKAQKAPVDLRRVLEDTLALRDYDLKLNNITVQRDIEPELPSVTADAYQLEQVFLNIINNAVDAMLEVARGGVLQVRIFTQEGCVCTEFQDTGPGMKEPSRVFDPFYTTKGVGKGTGLGLSICYGILKEHHGDVLAFNAPRGGAVFRIVLPASGAVARPRSTTRRERQDVMLQGRILIADDEDAVLEFEREVLTGAGAEVVTASGGEATIASLKQEKFDAVIVDTKMPGNWGGMDIYRWILEHRPDLQKRVIFTLSNIGDGPTQAFLEQTRVPYIAKPFEVADLISAARRMLEKSRHASAN